jgi:hypothetical protein
MSGVMTIGCSVNNASLAPAPTHMVTFCKSGAAQVLAVRRVIGSAIATFHAGDAEQLSMADVLHGLPELKRSGVVAVYDDFSFRNPLIGPSESPRPGALVGPVVRADVFVVLDPDGPTGRRFVFSHVLDLDSRYRWIAIFTDDSEKVCD